jgi:hypothetical protein
MTQRIHSLLIPALVSAVVVAAGLAPQAIPVRRCDARTPIASLPFTVDSCGSYYLVRCLSGTPGQNGIVVDADDATLDLAGFALEGVAGSLDGISVAAGRRNVTIHDGSVRGWGSNGIQAANASKLAFQRVRALENGLRGVEAGPDSRFVDCSGDRNGWDGLTFGAGSTVEGCVASENGLTGFNGSTRCVVRACTATENGQHGFAPSSDSVVVDCTAVGNGEVGIHVFLGGEVERCLTASNGVAGILVTSGALVRGNVSRAHSTAGSAGILVTGSGSRIEANHLADNLQGLLVTGTGNLVLANTSASGGTAFTIAAENAHGPLLTVAGVGPLPSADPRANLEF